MNDRGIFGSFARVTHELVGQAKLLANDIQLARSLDSQTHIVWANPHNRDGDIVTDPNSFARLARQYKHGLDSLVRLFAASLMHLTRRDEAKHSRGNSLECFDQLPPFRSAFARLSSNRIRDHKDNNREAEKSRANLAETQHRPIAGMSKWVNYETRANVSRRQREGQPNF
jgi:hypothetical protein